MSSTLIKRLKSDTDFRIKTFLFISFVFNLLYSIFLFVIGKIFVSQWFFAMSIYFGLLSTARIFMFFQTNPKKKKREKILILRACGYFLLFLNITVSIMSFILIRTVRHVLYHEITVITLATYTFATLSLAIISFIKQVKGENHVYFAIKSVSLISASVSILILTNTMLATFGDGDTLRNIILPILGGAVSIFIILTAVLMIRKANQRLRNLKDEQ